MKKIALFTLLLCFGNIYSQKKKKPEAVIPNIVITKNGNASAEMAKNNFYLFVANGAKKDTLLLKKYITKETPLDCKIISFATKGTPMYLVSWAEKSSSETKLKKEETTITESQIWNPATKTLVVGNTQTATKIKETVFLDKLKNASETQERMRNGGFVFTFLPEGDFFLKDKSSETRYSYNVTSLKYEVAKTASAPVKPVKKKRK